ncbi:MAG TPA: hypothetical protein VNN20_05505 [Thermodesulfobacteriota bacterium]|nr:hypothetical protein [Thermodesulfobacteriota bacterium]
MILKPKEKAERYELANAIAGMCYAFISFAENELKEKGSDQKALKLEITKLIGDVDEASHFGYSVAPIIERNSARLYWNQGRSFMYEQTKNLFQRLGLTDREKSEDNSRYLEIEYDDLERARVYLLKEKELNDRDWRQFVYEVRLMLSARFPKYLPKPTEE